MPTSPVEVELESELEGLRPGQHLCLLHASSADLRATIVPYFKMGLARNERCIYIADAASATEAGQMLVDGGIDVDAEKARGALRVFTTRDAYLVGGKFEADAMLEMLDRAAEDALADGFSGLRGSGEMNWALGTVPNRESLLAYESLLNNIFARRRFLGLCRYDIRGFPATLLRDVLRVHPIAVIGSLVCPSAYYEPPEMALDRCTEDDRVAWIIEQLQQSRRAKRVLEQAVRSRDEFLIAASHELRTPLTTIGLQVQSVLRQAAKAGAQGADLPAAWVQDKLRRADARVQGLLAMLARLLDVSQVEAGKMSLELRPLDLAAVVGNVADGLVPAFNDAGCAFELTVPEAPVVGCWDEMRLAQVVQNLLSNALKYGRGKPIEARITSDAERALLTIEDHGIGLAPDAASRIFERFERGVSLRHYGGFGVGLWLVRQIVEAFGGVVSATGAPGAGATFVVELPRHTEKIARAAMS